MWNDASLIAPETVTAIPPDEETTRLFGEKLCERLGMRREGLFKEFISFVNNADGTPRYENTCLYAQLKKEWESNQSQSKG